MLIINLYDLHLFIKRIKINMHNNNYLKMVRIKIK